MNGPNLAGHLSSYIERGDLSHVDVRFSELLMRLGQVEHPAMALLFARLSQALARQHSCLDLAADASRLALVDELRQVPVVSHDGTRTPLVLDGTNLYMQRYYHYETEVAARLVAMNQPIGDPDPAACRLILDSLFAGTSQAHQQRLAVLQAMTHQLTIITGGPGTGKTTILTHIIDALTRLDPDASIAIKLAAPTGKAAMRMKESLSGTPLPVMPDILTLHRLLGVRANGRDYRYNEHNKLPVDLLIIDEVSMIGVAMMYRLLVALPAHARLILLGDPNQLPSVEVGNILADICKYSSGYSPAFADFGEAAEDIPIVSSDTLHGLTDAVCQLDISHRFSPDRGIGRLSAGIRNGELVQLLDDSEVAIRPLATFTTQAALEFYEAYLALVAASADAAALLDAFDQIRILTPAREGEYGVERINREFELLLAERNDISGEQRFYHGRPILITRNDYNLRLFNGDAGICVHRPNQEPVVMFRDTGGELKPFLASRLPPHETCFAMTVHKSQGSEFERVVLVLPDTVSEPVKQIMTRELVYTAITRARHQISLYFDGSTLSECLARRSARHSGLGERLRDAT